MTDIARQAAPATRMNWKWMLAMGIVLIIGGFVALTNPFLATITAEAIAAATFLVAGGMQIVMAVRGEDGSTGARLLAGALGVLLILFALSLFVQPIAGLISLTILVASFFFALGLVRVYLSLRMRDRGGWGWMLASGLISVLLGLLIFLGLPGSALTVLGIFLGVELLVSGAASVAMALRNRREA